MNTQISKEGDSFLISTEVAKLSNLVVTTLGEEEHEHTDDDDNTVEIPLSNVKSSVLAKVVDYCKHYNVEPSKSLCHAILSMWCAPDKYSVLSSTHYFLLTQ